MLYLQNIKKKRENLISSHCLHYFQTVFLAKIKC